MSYDPNNLSAIYKTGSTSHANGFTLWHYKTIDGILKVENYGYFNEASNILNFGDFIILNCCDCNTIRYVSKSYPFIEIEKTE